MASNVQRMPNGNESHSKSNFLTAAADSNGTIDLPRGWYILNIYGTQTNAGAGATIALEKYVNSAQSIVAVLGAAIQDDTGYTAGAVSLATFAGVSVSFSNNVPSVATNTQPVYVPYGLKWTYTKGAATAVNLSFEALRVG